MKLTGRCLCGAVRWSHPGPELRNLVCHCRDCQQATSSGFTAFVGLQHDGVQWIGRPNHYQSSPGCWRAFCPDCGTRLYFRSEKWPGEIHMHAATLDEPANYVPDRHVVAASSPPWISLADDLPSDVGFHHAPRSKGA